MKLADVDEGPLGIELAAGSVRCAKRVHRAHVSFPVLQHGGLVYGGRNVSHTLVRLSKCKPLLKVVRLI